MISERTPASDERLPHLAEQLLQHFDFVEDRQHDADERLFGRRPQGQGIVRG